MKINKDMQMGGIRYKFIAYIDPHLLFYCISVYDFFRKNIFNGILSSTMLLTVPDTEYSIHCA